MAASRDLRTYGDMSTQEVQVDEAAVHGAAGQAGLHDLHPQLIVEIPEVQQLRPHALVAGQGVHSHVGAHGVELGSEDGVPPYVVPAGISLVHRE